MITIDLYLMVANCVVQPRGITPGRVSNPVNSVVCVNTLLHFYMMKILAVLTFHL